MWDDAFPSFLIGLREGLEAGLIVSILVASLARSGQKAKLPQVWTGVLAAVALSMSFGAVLTFTAANLSATSQEAFGGTLSVIAVAFVTGMVFWMRRSARDLSSDIKEKVANALAMGAVTLIVTSFLAVGREGLETALFLWTTAQTAHSSTGPLIGAGIGLALSVVLCWGLYRRVLKINLTKFFTITGGVLIVIAAGVLSYGVRDLQEGGVLPGGHTYAFNLTSIDQGSWYATLVQGVFNLTATMTWLQVIVYVVYLTVVMTLFVVGVRSSDKAAKAAKTAKTAEDEKTEKPEAPATTPRKRPVWVLPTAVVAVPAVVAGVIVAVSSGKQKSASTVSVSAADCGKGFTAPTTGRQVFNMHNTGGSTAEVYLLNPETNAVYGEIEGLAPGTTRPLVATISAGVYAWRCVPNNHDAVTSASVRVSGTGPQTAAVLPVSEGDLDGPLDAYKQYVDQGLATLQTQTKQLAADLAAGDAATARTDWLTAHLTYASLGAAYGTFEDFDKKINGRADGLPGGVNDPAFTGFHRIEYGLWHGADPATLAAPANQLADDVTGLRAAFPTQDFDPGDLPLRTHEILENSLQFQLTGQEDYGSGTTVATTGANLAGTKELLTILTPLIQARDTTLLPRVYGDIGVVETSIAAARNADGSWTAVDALPQPARMKLDASVSQLLEDLAPIPDLLEIRKAA